MLFLLLSMSLCSQSRFKIVQVKLWTFWFRIFSILLKLMQGSLEKIFKNSMFARHLRRYYQYRLSKLSQRILIYQLSSLTLVRKWTLLRPLLMEVKYSVQSWSQMSIVCNKSFLIFNLTHSSSHHRGV